MNCKKLAQELVRLAKVLISEDDGFMDSEAYLSQDDVDLAIGQQFVASMNDRDYLTFEEVKVLCVSCADKMKEAGVTRIKKSSFSRVAKMTWDECIAEAKATGKTNPEAFCGWLRAYGPHGTVKPSKPGKVPKGYHPQKGK